MFHHMEQPDLLDCVGFCSTATMYPTINCIDNTVTILSSDFCYLKRHYELKRDNIITVIILTKKQRP